ncbi:hypothetical protein KC19_2G294200 [Ceratodon purpureus]|uniref:Secreted protein n=1 Tax=Ceratodon purpureus TaxID=3225 RepID=A0A8T0IZJ6_CERPU|nr:hypothetical protein KC19_2G294200 [Ceratodon purpureus]
MSIRASVCLLNCACSLSSAWCFASISQAVARHNTNYITGPSLHTFEELNEETPVS